MSGFLERFARNSSAKTYKADANQLVLAGANTIIHFTVKTWDTLNEFDAGTYTFTARRSGFYVVGVSANIQCLAVPSLFTVGLIRNGAALPLGESFEINQVTNPQKTAVLYLPLNAGDTLQVRFTNAGANNLTILQSLNTWFFIRRLE